MEPFQNGVGVGILEDLPCMSCSQTFGIFDLGKITFGLSQANIIFQTTICTSTRKADILAIRTD